MVFQAQAEFCMRNIKYPFIIGNVTFSNIAYNYRIDIRLLCFCLRFFRTYGIHIVFCLMIFHINTSTKVIHWCHIPGCMVLSLFYRQLQLIATRNISSRSRLVLLLTKTSTWKTKKNMFLEISWYLCIFSTNCQFRYFIYPQKKFRYFIK